MYVIINLYAIHTFKRPVIVVTARLHDARERDIEVATKFIIYTLVSFRRGITFFIFSVTLINWAKKRLGITHW